MSWTQKSWTKPNGTPCPSLIQAINKKQTIVDFTLQQTQCIFLTTRNIILIISIFIDRTYDIDSKTKAVFLGLLLNMT